MTSLKSILFAFLEISVIFGYFYLPRVYRPYLLAVGVSILFLAFSLKLFLSSLETEKTVLSYDLMSIRVARTMISAYRDIVAYRTSSILSIIFFTIFIFVKLIQEPSLSNILEVVLIFGGVISLQIFHLLDLINHEPEISNVDDFVEKAKTFDSSKQVKIEGIINSVRKNLVQDFEFIEFELRGISGKNNVEITYIHREISEPPQIMEGSRIRIHGDYFLERDNVPQNLIEFDLNYPRIIIIEGYGMVEEIAFLYEEGTFDRQYQSGVVTINFGSDEDIISNADLVRKILRVTEIDHIYTIEDLSGQIEDYSSDELRKFMQLMVKQHHFEIIYDPSFGYRRIKKQKEKLKLTKFENLSINKNQEEKK